MTLRDKMAMRWADAIMAGQHHLEWLLWNELSRMPRGE